MFALFVLVVSCTDDRQAVTSERAADPEAAVVAPAELPTPTSVAVEPEPTPAGPGPIRVLAVMDETGVLAPLDGPALAGVVVEIDRINDAGGLLGREVQLTRIDSNARASVTARAVSRLADDPPDLLVVGCDTDFSKPALEIADELGLVTISPCADDPGYATGAWGLRNFTFGAPAGERGVIAAQTAVALHGTTALVLRDTTNPEALAFCDGFEAGFRQAGGTVSYRDEFNYDTLEPIEDRLAERGPQTDLITVCSHVPGGVDAAPSVIAMLRTGGFQAPVVAGSGVDEATWFANVPQLGDLTFVSWSSIHGNDPDQRVNETIERANENSDTPVAGVTTILGADAIDAWARAVSRVDSVEPARVASGLAAFADEPFASGEISFLSGARMDTSRLYRVLRLVGDEISVVDTVEVG